MVLEEAQGPRFPGCPLYHSGMLLAAWNGKFSTVCFNPVIYFLYQEAWDSLVSGVGLAAHGPKLFHLSALQF